MSILWLTRKRGCGHYLLKTICNNLIVVCSYQTVPAAHTTPYCTRLFHSSHFSNSIIASMYRGRHSIFCNSSAAALFVSRRDKSMKAEKQLIFSDDEHTTHENQGVEFPGGKIAFTSEMNFLEGSSENRVQCFRVLDEDGHPISSNMPEYHVSKELTLKVYTAMVTLQTMDALFSEVQRQGKIPFYLTSFGEEAINVASAAAFCPDDIILAQYREQGVLLWRGLPVQDFASQLFGNNIGHAKGRNMPILYGSKMHNYFTISAPLATQLPQAVGVAYYLKMHAKDACVVAYFGDGTTSEGDFHASVNFAAVLEAPVVFICRNNGWAISTPVMEQFRSDGVVVKGQAYGIESIRVDGNDALAVYNAVRKAREVAINEQRPILIEAMTYRVAHHSTSDNSTMYRPKDEIEHWKTMHSPITRLRNWIERNGWWSQKEESELLINLQKQIKQAIKEAENEPKSPLKEMFTDVYEELPSNLIEQEKLLREAIERHPEDYPTDISR